MALPDSPGATSRSWRRRAARVRRPWRGPAKPLVPSWRLRRRAARISGADREQLGGHEVSGMNSAAAMEGWTLPCATVTPARPSYASTNPP
jgi:hypothetical protein